MTRWDLKEKNTKLERVVGNLRVPWRGFWQNIDTSEISISLELLIQAFYNIKSTPPLHQKLKNMSSAALLLRAPNRCRRRGPWPCVTYENST